MPYDDYPAFLRPALRLFLSVDLVGSTRLKQPRQPGLPARDDAPSPAAGWFPIVASFYRDFELQFLSEWADYKTVVAPRNFWESGPDPELWKTNGDELIYVKDIHDAREAYACTTCWLRTLRRYRAVLADGGSGLDVKATGWLAGFPVRNHEIIFLRNTSGIPDPAIASASAEFVHFYYLEKWHEEGGGRADLIRDFVGPSIDTGFRIAALSTARKFPLSIDLALLMSSVTEIDDGQNDIVLRYDGAYPLKGVLGGKPYPLFWIDTFAGDGRREEEDRLYPQPPSQNPQKMRRYCSRFIAAHLDYLHPPYTTHGTSFRQAPSNFDDELKALHDHWLEEKKKLEEEPASLRHDQSGNQGTVGGVRVLPIGEEDASSFARDIKKS